MEPTPIPQTSYEALGAGGHRSAWGTWFETKGPLSVMNSTYEVSPICCVTTTSVVHPLDVDILKRPILVTALQNLAESLKQCTNGLSLCVAEGSPDLSKAFTCT